MELHGCAMAEVGTVWHMRSAEWQPATPRRSHHCGPTPHAFPMRVLRFQVFWKVFSSFVIMKYFLTQLLTL